jgi:UDP:flavonoid glycosyltransferase YjiC (YdhE family)
VTDCIDARSTSHTYGVASGVLMAQSDAGGRRGGAVARILVVTWDGGGNVPPMLGIATCLGVRGHTVRVLGHPQQAGAVADAGVEFTAYRQASAWSPREPVPDLRWSMGMLGLSVETGHGRDVAAELEGPDAPDLVLVDCMRLAALRTGLRAGVPMVALVHTFHRYVARTWARGPAGVLAASRGLRAPTLWNDCARVLVASDRGLDPDGTGALPANVRHTGPVLPPARAGRRGGRPTVLVSLSTIFYPAQATVLATILEALTGLDVHVVVATGPGADPAGLPAGPDVEIHQHVPHDEVLPVASLVIGHGGHGTTMRALAHDVPLIVVPLDRNLDHTMIGYAVARAGAGAVVPTNVPADRLRAVVRELLDDPAAHVAAARIGARLRARPGADRAADEIEALLPARAADR